MELTEANTLPGEIEKLAEGFESRDFPFAAVCANKIVNLLVPDQPHEDEAFKTTWLAEAHKTIKALDTKDFGLASMCLRKMVKHYDGNPPALGVSTDDAKAVKHYFEEISIFLSAQEFPNVAIYVRKLFKKLVIGPAPAPVVEETAGEPEPAG